MYNGLCTFLVLFDSLRITLYHSVALHPRHHRYLVVTLHVDTLTLLENTKGFVQPLMVTKTPGQNMGVLFKNEADYLQLIQHTPYDANICKRVLSKGELDL